MVCAEQIKSNVLVFVLAAAAFAAACSDNPVTEPSPPNGNGNPGDTTAVAVRLSIVVWDTTGKPVPGLRVSSWFHPSIDFFAGIRSDLPGDDASPLYATVIRFSLLLTSRVKLSVLDMRGALVRNLVDEVKPTGLHSVVWGGAPGLPGGVYKCRLIARDVLFNNVLFADSIYAVLWTPDAEQSVLGVTDSEGKFATSDSLLFPSVLDLPPLVSTDAICGVGENFTIEDTVTIVLTDTDTGDQQTYQRAIFKDAESSYSFVWNPASKARVIPAGQMRYCARADGPDRKAKSGKQQLEWRLYQNCPNPFN